MPPGHFVRVFVVVLAYLGDGSGEPTFDLVGILLVEDVGEFAERMANDHAQTWAGRIGNAMLERGAVDVEGGGEIALHAKDGIAHQTHPATARRSFGDVGRFFQLRLEQAFAESGRFFHGLVRHGAHRFLEMTEPAVLMEENACGHSGPDEDMRVDVTGGAGTHVEHCNPEVPNKEKRCDDTFGEKAMEGWLAQRVDAATEH